ncbi:insulinase family protein, partial [Candidatus Aminicenantes bacterium AC-335-L06]|nr:insulinase family protein [Candidatus Aminicenantes bacterium AC-335-L06]
YYLPNNSHLIIIGDLNFRELIRRISHYLNIWKSGKIPKISFPPVKVHKKKVIYFVDSPTVERPYICLGNTFYFKNKMDYFPLIVLNQILGGTTTSRLFMNLRETKEIAFSARSYLDFFGNSGLYIIEAEVRQDAVKESIVGCLSELKRLRSSGIPLLELEQAKYYLIGNFPVQLNKENGLINHLIKGFMMSIDEKTWNKYQHNIMSVDQERVLSIARKYFASYPAIIVVGNRKKILKPLLDFEVIEVYDTDGNLKYKIEKEMR